jgi:hypothetical protein
LHLFAGLEGNEDNFVEELSVLLDADHAHGGDVAIFAGEGVAVGWAWLEHPYAINIYLTEYSVRVI